MLILQAEGLDEADNPDSVPSSPSSSEKSSSEPSTSGTSDSDFGRSEFSQAEATGDFQSLGAERAAQKKGALRKYVCSLSAILSMFYFLAIGVVNRSGRVLCV